MSGTDDAARLDAPTATLTPMPTLVVRLALAALTGAAGVVHLVMVPQHAQESTLDGLLFLLAGWAQLGLAVALLAWPRKAVLQATAVVNFLCVIAWTVSRTTACRGAPSPASRRPRAPSTSSPRCSRRPRCSSPWRR